MEKFVIQGGHALQGEITPAGNKNAALPLLASCLLTREPVILRNVPAIVDVKNMRSLLESLGVKFTNLDAHTWQIEAREIHPADLDPDLCRKIRASIIEERLERLIFAFLVRTRNESFESFFNDRTAVFGDGFQTPVHQLSPSALRQLYLVGVNSTQTGLHILLNKTCQFLQGLVAFNHVAACRS